jgi:hypothetical protein
MLIASAAAVASSSSEAFESAMPVKSFIYLFFIFNNIRNALLLFNSKKEKKKYCYSLFANTNKNKKK